MSGSFVPLRELVQLLSMQSRAHICIHDVSGILHAGMLRLDVANIMHSKDFCSAAKASPNGYRMCITCKMLANKKAVTRKEPFRSYCPYGLFEIVRPVLVEGKTQCIIYIGNLIFDREETAARVRRTCRITKAPQDAVLAHLEEAQVIESADYYVRLAELIDSYIRLLYEHSQPDVPQDGLRRHWAVTALQNYIHLNYNQNLSLQRVSRLYFINDKYIGRLFKQQTGSTFHEYLNSVRLEKATAFLQNGRMNIITVALNSGFQNVTYFNRVFHKKYGVTPVEYRSRCER